MIVAWVVNSSVELASAAAIAADALRKAAEGVTLQPNLVPARFSLAGWAAMLEIRAPKASDKVVNWTMMT